MISFDIQPKVIQKFIFSFLPAEDMCICRLVCQQWKKNINELLNPVFRSKLIIFNKFPVFGCIENNNKSHKDIKYFTTLIHDTNLLFKSQKAKLVDAKNSNLTELNFHKTLEDSEITAKLNEMETKISKIACQKSSLETKFQELKKEFINARNDILNHVDGSKQILNEQFSTYKIMHIIENYYGDAYKNGILYDSICELNSAIKPIKKQLSEESEILKKTCLHINTMDLNGLDIEMWPESILKCTSQLTHLEINHNKIKIIEIKSKTLTHLTATDNKLNDINLKDLKQLTDLNLSGNQIKKIDLTGNPKLININISNNPLQINGFNLSNNPFIKTLNISNNFSTDKSKSSLDLTNNKMIEILNLENCSNVEVVLSKAVRSKLNFELGAINNIIYTYEGDDSVETDEEDPYAPLVNSESVDSSNDGNIGSSEDDS